MPFLGSQPAETALTTGDLGADIVTNAKIADDQIDSEHYIAASNEHLADDAVGVAELSATGTASSSTFLRGDNAWAAAGGGKILQVVNGDSDVQYGANNTSYTASGQTLSITPSATSSKIWCVCSGTMSGDTPASGYIGYYVHMYRLISGGSYTAIGNEWGAARSTNVSGTLGNFISLHVLDSPSTTSACTYQPYLKASISSFQLPRTKQATSG